MQLWIFPLQLASLDTSGPHACYDHTHALTMQQDITTAQQGLWMRMSALLLLLVAFLGRIKGTRFMHASLCVVHKSHPTLCSLPSERPLHPAGWTWTGTLQGLLFFCSKGKSRYLLALGPYQSHCSNYAEINISYT